MTQEQITLALALVQVTMVPGIRTKSFARDMALLAAQPNSRAITPSQHKYLVEAVIRYRRQIPENVVQLAMRLQGGA